MADLSKADETRLQQALLSVSLSAGAPRSAMFRFPNDSALATLGGRTLVFRLRNADPTIERMLRKTNRKIGEKLVKEALIFLGMDAGSRIGKAIQFEQWALTRGESLRFGLVGGSATYGNAGTGSQPLAPGPLSGGVLGIWREHGTGLWGIHRRQTVPMTWTRYTYKGRKRYGTIGMRPRPFLTPAHIKSQPFIDKKYVELGRAIGVYLGHGRIVSGL